MKLQHRLKNWTGTVHWSETGQYVACGKLNTADSWLAPTVERVTCARCIARFGDDAGNTATDAPVVQEHVARRAAERAARRAARGAA